MYRWGAAAYALLSVLVVGASWFWMDRLPLTHPEPWLVLSAPMAHGYSLLLGLVFGGLLVISSRASVGRFRWAQRMHEEFRPVASQLSPGGVVVLATLSAVGEELLFRGLLQPYAGLMAQAVLFGLLHQMPGPSRWVWCVWAGAVGLGLGALFALTGSLLGPIAAHAVVNGLNLSYLKHHEVPTRRAVGGLLDRGLG
jgi:membrane protease YdiL (CAAX protease family)